jgi:hypothetical protein
MKRIAFIWAIGVFCIAIPGAMFAQTNAALGTWKLNLEKSKYPTGMAPKELTRTLTADGDSVKYSFEGKAADGSDLKYGFTVKYGGDFFDATGTGTPYGADKISIKQVNSHQFSAILKKGDKEVGTSTVTVSHDGKLCTVYGKGTGPDGKPVKLTQVFDKQ